MRISSVIAAAVLLLATVASADDSKPAPGAHASSTTTKVENEMLAHIQPGASANASQGAGGAREVKLEASQKAAPADRKMATPRMMKKMKTAEAMQKVASAIEACADKNASTSPASLTLRVSVAPDGSVDGAEPVSAKVATPMLACVQAAVKTATFGAPGGTGALIAVPVTVPGKPAAK